MNTANLPRFGYIGLGMMGSAMAQNLTAGAPESVLYDLDEQALERSLEHGGVGATSPADVASSADVISVCVPAARHIEAVLTGDDGLCTVPLADKTILVHSTIHPDEVLALRDLAATAGAELFDVCVAGGDETAKVGEQLVLAGGYDQMNDSAKALVDVYAGEIINAGGPGAGAAVKIAVNVMTYAQFAAARSAHSMLTSGGQDPAVLLKAWKSMGQLGVLTERYAAILDIPNNLVAGELRSMLETQLSIAQKDLSLAADLGEISQSLKQFLEQLHDSVPAIYALEEG